MKLFFIGLKTFFSKRFSANPIPNHMIASNRIENHLLIPNQFFYAPQHNAGFYLQRGIEHLARWADSDFVVINLL